MPKPDAKDFKTEELIGAAILAGAELDEGLELLDEVRDRIADALENLGLIVPELAHRAAQAPEILPPTGTAVVDWIQEQEDATALEDILDTAAARIAELAELETPTTPATPKPPGAPRPASDRFEAFNPNREVVLEDGDDENTIREKIGSNAAGARIIVRGDVGPIHFGGKGQNAIAVNTQDGEQGVEVLGEGNRESSIAGVQLDPLNLSGEVRFREVGLSPHSDGAGNSIGDYAPLRSMGDMPGVHVILEAARLFAPEKHLDRWKGTGAKWGAHLKRCRLTSIDTFGSSFQEHLIYGLGLEDPIVVGAYNEVRWIMGADGVVRPLGCGRTLLQFTNRFPALFPKGGAPSSGDIRLVDCVANRTGWEGLIDKIDANGELIEPTHGAGGGAAFTVSGHTGELVRLEGCRVVNPYANGLAVYVDTNKQKAGTPTNPEGVRSWMIDQAGEIYDPSAIGLKPDEAWATRRLELVDFQQDRRGSRMPFLVAGVQEICTDRVELAGEYGGAGSPHMRLDYQDDVSEAISIETAPEDVS